MWNPVPHSFDFGLATQLSQTKRQPCANPTLMKSGSRVGDEAQTHIFDPPHYPNWVWCHMLMIPTCEVKRLHRKIKINLGYSSAYLITPHTPSPKKRNSEAYSQSCPDQRKPKAAKEESYMEEKGAALPALRQAQPVSHVCEPLALVTVIRNPHLLLPNSHAMNMTAIYKKGSFLFYSYVCLQFYIYLYMCTVSPNQPLFQGGKQ